MSEISEAGYHAGWMAGLEYDLWRILLRDGPRYGHHDLSDRERDRLRELFRRCGGWITFDDEQGESFVPIADWHSLFAAHEARLAGPKN
ncbi:MAG TPA: hypothetical protein VHD32_06985 [Candidatus Didemnitutus sp.]|nr:hypothetical protein [Candidatus Didemnitutus sp.]